MALLLQIQRFRIYYSFDGVNYSGTMFALFSDQKSKMEIYDSEMEMRHLDNEFSFG